jgi:hypothetical protein
MLVHDRGSRRQRAFLDVDGDGVSLDWIDRKINSERSQGTRCLATESDDIGVRIEHALIGDDAGHAVAFEQQSLHVRVESESDTASRQKVGEGDGELVAVAGLVIGQMQAARQPDSRGAQCRFHRHHVLGADNAVRDAKLGEHARGAFRRGELFLGAKDLQHAAGAVIEHDAGVRHELLQACLAVMGDALHARLVPCEAFGGTVAQKAQQPAPLIRIEPWVPGDRRVPREQPARNFCRQSRRRPWSGKSRADSAGIGKARFQCGAALAVEHDHVVTRLEEIVGAARSNHARAQHHHPHGASLFALTRP